MAEIKNILDFLNKKFPFETACDFDNVGLLIGDKNANVSKITVALDCDTDTVDFAVDNGCELIVTHHPVIFDPIKSITADTVYHKAVKNGISVISCHTNLDIANGGVTETLCKVLGFKSIKKYKTESGFLLRSAKTDICDAKMLAERMKAAVDFGVRYADAGKPIQNVLVCSGSGGEFLSDAISGGFDALVTADVKHNVFVSAVNNGISVFDLGHYASENVIVSPLCEQLKKQFGINVIPFNSKKLKYI